MFNSAVSPSPIFVLPTTITMLLITLFAYCVIGYLVFLVIQILRRLVKALDIYIRKNNL